MSRKATRFWLSAVWDSHWWTTQAILCKPVQQTPFKSIDISQICSSSIACIHDHAEHGMPDFSLHIPEANGKVGIRGSREPQLVSHRSSSLGTSALHALCFLWLSLFPTWLLHCTNAVVTGCLYVPSTRITLCCGFQIHWFPRWQFWGINCACELT